MEESASAGGAPRPKAGFKLTKAAITKLQKNPMAILQDLSENEIASIIQQANHSYYNEKTPVFSDNLFDMIKEFLQAQNPNHPILKAVGAAVEDRKVTLPFFMGSLDKIKGEEKELAKFRVKYPGTYVASDKLDGNSALLCYDKDKTQLYSRGDGAIGQDISHIIPFAKHIPKDIFKKQTIIRGEMIISKRAFDKLKDKGANARNMVAGVLNAKLPDLEIAGEVEFVAYEVIVPKMEPSVQMEFLKKSGFKVVFNTVLKEAQLTNEHLSQLLTERRDKGEFEIDGIVVMHNKMHNRVSDGNPSYGFAFKSIHTMAKAEIIVQNVEWNLSKDGYLIPVVNFQGVWIDGSTVKRATGFNGKFIKDNKIGPGSKLVIMKAGLVIPKIEEILSPSETGEPQMPEVAYVWSASGVDIMLPDNNRAENAELRFKNFDNFFVKIDIKGLSSGNLKKIYDAGFNTVKKVLDASVKDLLKVDGFKDKMATKVFEGVQERMKTLDCLTIMEASNVMGRGLGRKKLELIVAEFPRVLSERYVPSLTELVALKGIESKTATVFITNLPAFFQFIDENDLSCFMGAAKKAAAPDSGAAAKADAGPSGSNPPTPVFAGKKYVFTEFRSKELEEYIVARGGVMQSAVSKQTTAVITKDASKETTKTKKAESLGIPVIGLEEFKRSYNIAM